MFSFTSLQKIAIESIDKQNSALLGSEVLNQLLHYLREDEKHSAEFSKEKDISEKETYALQYLAGYIFHKLYKKSKMVAKKYEDIQYCRILLGAKVFQDEEQILVNAKDCGLWKIVKQRYTKYIKHYRKNVYTYNKELRFQNK